MEFKYLTKIKWLMNINYPIGADPTFINLSEFDSVYSNVKLIDKTRRLQFQLNI